MIRLISDTERALGELKGVTEVLANPDLFVVFYVKKEALLSSQIEGTECTLDDVIQVDANTDRLKPVGEVINYINALNFGLERLQNLPFSTRLLNLIHERLLEGVRGQGKYPGELKRTQNWIGPSGCNLREATYVPPPPHETAGLMSDLEKFYHFENTLPPLLKASVLHSHFETIHPYLDGNGRLGRLLVTFFLCEQEILSRPLLYLSLFFKEHKDEYYELLTRVRLEGDWESWMKFFLKGVRETALEASHTVREILALQKEHREKIQTTLRTISNPLATYELFLESPIRTITDVRDCLEVTYPTAKKTVDALIEKGILSDYNSRERGKKIQYHQYLEILRRGT